VQGGYFLRERGLGAMGVCAEEAVGSVSARGGWWRVCTRAAVR
jgi:hypothetical protein